MSDAFQKLIKFYSLTPAATTKADVENIVQFFTSGMNNNPNLKFTVSVSDKYFNLQIFQKLIIFSWYNVGKVR